MYSTCKFSVRSWSTGNVDHDFCQLLLTTLEEQDYDMENLLAAMYMVVQYNGYSLSACCSRIVKNVLLPAKINSYLKILAGYSALHMHMNDLTGIKCN